VPYREGSGSKAESDDVETTSPSFDSLRRASVRLFAKLPRPTRLLWICLLLLGVYAIAFSLQGSGIVPIIGTANPAHVIENCAADGVILSRGEWYTLLAAAAGLPARWREQ